MIAIDGPPPTERGRRDSRHHADPFAVVTFFEPDATVALNDPLDYPAVLERVEEALPGAPARRCGSTGASSL